MELQTRSVSISEATQILSDYRRCLNVKPKAYPPPSNHHSLLIETSEGSEEAWKVSFCFITCRLQGSHTTREGHWYRETEQFSLIKSGQLEARNTGEEVESVKM